MQELINSVFEKSTSAVLGRDIVRNHVLAPQIVNSGAVSVAVKHLLEMDSSLEPCTIAPVFVLSAGWGSGSTLVQRLIISSGDYLIWGEPLDEAAPVQRLAETVAAFRPSFPPETQFAKTYDHGELSRSWIANLVPPVEAFRHAHQQFFLAWLSETCEQSNFHSWGLKEVRLTIDHARYLKWLFPKAKFVFVYRDLYDCYLSCRRKPWISVWPDYKVSPIVSFSHHWNLLLSGFLEHCSDVGGLLVKYEDLVSGEFAIEELGEYLEISRMDKSLLDKKVGGRSKDRRPLIWPEKVILDSIGGRLRRQLGYRA